MNKLKNALIAFAGLLSLIGAIALLTPHASYSQSGSKISDVNVVNTPNVNAQQRGAWNVAINGTPTVNLAASSSVGINPSSNTVHVASSSREPVYITQALAVTDVFQKQLEITLENGVGQGSTSFTVPADKLLVIEDVSGFANMGQSGQIPEVTYSTTANNSLAFHWLAAFEYGFSNHYSISGGNLTSYAGPGSTVELTLDRSSYGTVGTASLNLTFSGHYINQ